MKDFPDFIKSKMNHIDSSQQNTKDIDGYYFEGKDGSQMLFGHTILIENQKNRYMNLMSILFV